jgi:hypothetical protein
MLDRTEFLLATRQLAAAAELLAKAGPENLQIDALQMLALFRKHEYLSRDLSAVATNDDELFARTGQAALTMAGRKEFAASHALLRQARSLLPST